MTEWHFCHILYATKSVSIVYQTVSTKDHYKILIDLDLVSCLSVASFLTPTHRRDAIIISHQKVRNSAKLMLPKKRVYLNPKSKGLKECKENLHLRCCVHSIKRFADSLTWLLQEFLSCFSWVCVKRKSDLGLDPFLFTPPSFPIIIVIIPVLSSFGLFSVSRSFSKNNDER